MTDEQITENVEEQIEEQPKVTMYEEWIAFPDKREFASTRSHEAYAKVAGWWCTDWLGDEAAVRQRGYKPRN